MQKHRKLKRRHLIYYLRVFDKGSGIEIGHLVDVTKEGMMLISERPLATGQTMDLYMLLPQEIFGREELGFQAQCMWSRPDINPSFFDSGLRLTGVDDKDKECIEDLIVQYGFRD
jgi:hypothetical protein